MTFIGNAKESNGQSWMPVLRYGKEIPMRGKLGEDQIETDLSYAILMKTIIAINYLKKFYQLKEKRRMELQS